MLSLHRFRFLTLTLTFASAVFAAACGGKSEKPPAPAASGAQPSAIATGPAPTLTGTVISIDMVTDEKGSYFSPNTFEAHRGDILRFVLKSGVHNVHFLPDSNPGMSGLPPGSDFLQIPGQTWDLTVTMPPGQYSFQCDPHAALGMVAKLEVEDEKD